MEIIDLDRIDITFDGRLTWEFAKKQRKTIDEYFLELRKRQPELWNGRVLLLNRFSIDVRVLTGTCFETDYASLIAWRDWGYPDDSAHNFFAAGALQSADRAYLVGEMAPYTACAGQCYFPCGNPEPIDIHGHAMVDLEENLAREIFEETGLELKELNAQSNWTMLRDRGLMAFIKNIKAREMAEALRSRILQHLSTDPLPEFLDIHIIRSSSDFRAQMPRYVMRYLEAVALPHIQ